jgi:hypothetical protein
VCHPGGRREPFYALADDPVLPDSVYVPVPAVVGEFVERFDVGRYPRLSVGDAAEERNRFVDADREDRDADAEEEDHTNEEEEREP